MAEKLRKVDLKRASREERKERMKELNRNHKEKKNKKRWSLLGSRTKICCAVWESSEAQTRKACCTLLFDFGGFESHPP